MGVLCICCDVLDHRSTNCTTSMSSGSKQKIATITEGGLWKRSYNYWGYCQCSYGDRWTSISYQAIARRRLSYELATGLGGGAMSNLYRL